MSEESSKYRKKVLTVALVFSMLISHFSTSVFTGNVQASFAALEYEYSGEEDLSLGAEVEAVDTSSANVASIALTDTSAVSPELQGAQPFSGIDTSALCRNENWVRGTGASFPFPRSSIVLPNARLTGIERADWMADYWAMGGPSSFEMEVIRLTNEIRTSVGLGAVQLDHSHAMAARFYAQTMANLNTGLSHNEGPYGGSAAVGTVFGVPGSWRNGAAGSSTPEIFLRGHPNWEQFGWSTPMGLMDSYGHCMSILHPNARFIGVGTHVGGRWGVFHYMYLSATPAAPRRAATVVNGRGSGQFSTGETVSIRATVQDGYRFVRWDSSSGVQVANATAANTTFTMPANNATVTAILERIPVATTAPTTTAPTTTAPTTAAPTTAAPTTTSPTTTAPTTTAPTTASTTTSPTTAPATTSPTTTTTAPTTPIPTHSVTVVGGTGEGDFEVGEVVKINATVPVGYRFVNWESESEIILADASSIATTFVMPANDVTVTAIVERIPSTTTLHTVTVKGGIGEGEFEAGETVKISAIIPNGFQFVGWESTPTVSFADETAAITSFVMPANDVSISAIVEQIPPSIQTYTLTVIGGTGAGNFEAGEVVKISAVIPDGLKFVGWESTPAVSFADETAVDTVFVMPTSDVTITAIFGLLADSTDPTEATGSTNSTDPTNSINSTDPTDPTEATGSTAATRSTEATKPTASTETSDLALSVAVNILDSWIAEISELEARHFTPESWAVLDFALQRAMEVLDSGDIDAILAAITSLQSAFGSLVHLVTRPANPVMALPESRLPQTSASQTLPQTGVAAGSLFVSGLVLIGSGLGLISKKKKFK